jgi:hypothetical protein
MIKKKRKKERKKDNYFEMSNVTITYDKKKNLTTSLSDETLQSFLYVNNEQGCKKKR